MKESTIKTKNEAKRDFRNGVSLFFFEFKIDNRMNTEKVSYHYKYKVKWRSGKSKWKVKKERIF